MPNKKSRWLGGCKSEMCRGTPRDIKECRSSLRYRTYPPGPGRDRAGQAATADCESRRSSSCRVGSAPQSCHPACTNAFRESDKVFPRSSHTGSPRWPLVKQPIKSFPFQPSGRLGAKGADRPGSSMPVAGISRNEHRRACGFARRSSSFTEFGSELWPEDSWILIAAHPSRSPKKSTDVGRGLMRHRPLRRIVQNSKHDRVMRIPSHLTSSEVTALCRLDLTISSSRR